MKGRQLNEREAGAIRSQLEVLFIMVQINPVATCHDKRRRRRRRLWLYVLSCDQQGSWSVGGSNGGNTRMLSGPVICGLKENVLTITLSRFRSEHYLLLRTAYLWSVSYNAGWNVLSFPSCHSFRQQGGLTFLDKENKWKKGKNFQL